MKLQMILLALLARRPQSGYELWQWLSIEGRYFRTNSDRSQIYRTLAALSDEGLVDFTVEPSDQGPDAKIYRLSEAGVRRVNEWIDSPYKPPEVFTHPEFRTRFLLGGAIRPDSLLRLIDVEISTREELRRRFRNRDQRIRVSDDSLVPDVALAQALTDDIHRYGSEEVDGWIEWLKGQREKIVRRLASPPRRTTG